MNFLDLAIVAVMITSGLGGWQLGLLTGGTSWVVLVQSLVLATLALPVIVPVLGGGSPAVRLIIGAAVFVVAGYAGQYVGAILGRRLRRSLLPEDGPARRWDRVAGAVAAPVAVVMGLWLLVLPPLGDLAGSASDLTRRSALSRVIEAAFPDPPDTSRALRRLVGPAGDPGVFGGLVPDIETGPPPQDSGLTASVLARVTASTVKVDGVACRAEREGSGFAVGPDLVVTNAHVVAGEDETTVVRPDGRRLRAKVAVFDPAVDLALLQVPGLGQAPLPLASGEVASTVAVFGHPGGQAAIKVSPAAVRQQVKALGQDLYETGLSRRAVLVLAADLAPGDSGAAVVNGDGKVVAVAFAIAPGDVTTAYALASSEVRALLDAPRSPGAATGPCLG